jgi:hypothetical protein
MATYTRQITIARRNHILPHRWELHGKRNINNSQEGIKIEC